MNTNKLTNNTIKTTILILGGLTILVDSLRSLALVAKVRCEAAVSVTISDDKQDCKTDFCLLMDARRAFNLK